MKTDLHTHSTASDGFYNPSTLVSQAGRAGIRLLALTDHDTIEGLEEARRAADQCRIELVPGVELSTDVGLHEVHILGYWIDDLRPELRATLGILKSARRERIVQMLERLRELGMPIQPEDVLTDKPGTFGRPQVALAMVQRGYVSSIDEAFVRFLGVGRPAYVPHFKLTPLEAIDLVRKAGGLAVLAHPGLAGRDDLIPSFLEAGLGGIEAYYPEHDRATTLRYRGLAKHYNLLVTAGSDFHGPGFRKNPLGQPALPPRDLERFLSWEPCRGLSS